jgi:hypothetical protein
VSEADFFKDEFSKDVLFKDILFKDIEATLGFQTLLNDSRRLVYGS